MKKSSVSKVLDIFKKSIFGDLLGQVDVDETKITSEDISELITQLVKEKTKIVQNEKKEKKRKEELEAVRKRQEEKQKEKQHIEDVTSMELPLDWDNLFDHDPRTEGVHAESVSDGLILSLSNLGKVDIEYISSITGEDYKTVIGALKGSIYQNPELWDECFYKGWETAEEYLSGNLMRKWKSAQTANSKYKGYFQNNIDALSKVLPATVNAKDIYITLGSPWVPVDIIDEFIVHILNLKGNPIIGTKHDELTGSWEIPNKSFYFLKNSVASIHVYGTPKMEALYILERTLNMKTVTVTEEVTCLTNKSGKKRVINKNETLLALEKQQKLIKEFQDWVWKDAGRKERLEMIFENNFGCVRKRTFDGSFLTFPNMSPDIELYDYQKNAIARILFSPNTLLAHDVGSGKTYIMIAAGMELKRMGISNKNLYVVPNNIVGQWQGIFKSMYPNANLLCIEPKNFTPEKREKQIEKIRDGDFDGIIMAYSCFEQIPISRDYYINELTELKDKIKQLGANAQKVTSRLNKKREAITKKLSELVVICDNDDGIYFDELGITRLFVDEAHNFKNVPIETKVDRVLGISTAGSKKCKEMMDKVRIIQQKNAGGGVVMATGTPITNSITDAFIMQLYLQSGELALLDLQNFDSWIGMFAEKVTEFEVDVDTNSYRLATRFSKFHNIPELTSLLSSIADFHQVDGSVGIPDFDGYSDSLIGKTPEFKNYLEDISKRADRVRKGTVNRQDDNMLKITTDGRKAALDIRLLEKNAAFNFQSKVARCAENVFDIYLKTKKEKSTQIIFCDTSTPKKEFNVYDEISRLLILWGIPEIEIAYVHNAETQRQRNLLFKKFRNGDIRILIGSTFKLGLGVNVQDKLIALHHLDIPWRPADMTQREGRILRQGNTNQKVSIYRYITEGSFDAYSWQLLETKQRFITGILSGSMTERSGSDIEDTVLDYAEVKALAVGNPLIKERVETANELSRNMVLQKKAIDAHIRLEKELFEIPAKIKHQENIIEKCRKDIEVFKTSAKEYDKDERKELREKIHEAVQGNVLAMEEKVLLEYQGFKIVLPTNMTAEKPFVWLQNNGKYYVELGETSIGGLIRIDNYLENLQKHLEKLEEAYQNLITRKSALEIELAKKENYTDIIEQLTEKLKIIDEKLGVKK